MSIRDDIISLTGRLKSLRRYVVLCRSVYAIVLIATTLLVSFAIANLLHALFYLDVTVRAVFVGAVVLILLFLMFKYLLLPILFKPSLETISRRVERKYPELKNRVIASLQLERNLHENRENYSQDMIKALIAQTSGMVNGLDLKSSHSNRRLISMLKYFGAAIAVTVLLAFLTPGLFWSSLHVFSHPLEEIELPRTYELTVSPGNKELLKYDPLELAAVVKGEKLPDKAEIFWDNSGEGNWRSDELERKIMPEASSGIGNVLGMNPDSTVFTYKFKEIRHDFVYFVRAGREKSPQFKVTVADKPRITGLKLTYMYPKYTRLKPLVIDENDGNIQALRGTKVNIELTANKQIEQGALLFSDGSKIDLKCDGKVSSGTIKVDKDLSYHAEVTDRSGYGNPDPIEYRVTALDDAYPEIYMVSPSGNVDLNDDMAVRLMANLIDDFGFTKLTLNYTVHLTATEEWKNSEKIDISGYKPEQQIDYFWDLANVGLLPGSWIEYYLEVFDNDYITGPKSATGPVMAVRLPTLGEIFTQIESSREDQINEYVKALQEQEKIGEEFREMTQELRLEKELDWEDKKTFESVSNRQEQLLNDYDKLAKQFKETNQQAKENQLLTLQMIQKIEELQKLFEKVATDEMKEAMKKLQEALDKMDKEAVEKAMENFDMSLEDVLQNIERAIAQLKQLQADQMMQDMIRQAEEILKNQQNVNKRTEKSDREKLSGLAPKEQQNKNSLEDLMKKSDELKELFKEAKMNNSPSSKEFCKAAKESGAEKDMEQMISNLSNSEKLDAMMSGDSSEEKLKKMIEQMKDAQMALSQQMGEKMAKEMRKALDDVFYLTDKQEEMLGNVGQSQMQPSKLRKLAEDQRVLQSQASALRQKLIDIAKESVFMQSKISDLMKLCTMGMDRATLSLTEMHASQATGSQKDAIQSLNQASRVIMESINSQQQCNSSCNKPSQSMFKKMGKMCKKQKRINQQSQNMCNNPNKLGKSDRSMMERLAAEQSAVRKSIQQLQEEIGDRKQIKGRLENMADEMRRVVESLEQGSLNDQTLERQNKIYQRMLDFQLSMERQDYSETRRATAADQILRVGPESLDAAAQIGSESYERRLQKFLEEGYPPEYEEIIKDYFKAIMEVDQ